MEVDKKYGLFKPGTNVLDLGCSPGSWAKYAAEQVGPSGTVLGVDLKEPEADFSNYARFQKIDVFELSWKDLMAEGRFDVILSDMAPATTGVKIVDQARSAELMRTAMQIAGFALKSGGALLVKVFQGPDVEELFKELAGRFQTIRRIKPKSSRSFSPEIFGLATGHILEKEKNT
ncbi:MAG: RlmE family RNA methyltransferase [Deltaproteobacteria bacterium]|nr:RlmE family RNA methyltransferase [Deltaproteobacteria bacterium]